MFNIVTGNVFDSPNIDVIVQGCNCFNTMGSGVARIIHDEYPGAYEIDQSTISGDRTKLGTYTIWCGPHSRIPGKAITIVNAYTQYEYGRNRMHADYVAIRNAMLKLKANSFPEFKIGFPFIGAGLAGGDPQVILAIFSDVFSNSEHDATLFLRDGEFMDIKRTK